jgi:hypothetical protein
MSEHVAECMCSEPADHEDCRGAHDVRVYASEWLPQCHGCGRPCLCAQLTVCEDRVLATKGAPAAAWAKGYAAGLAAAREAVAACPRAGNSVYRGGLIEADTALAAIDALMEGK